MSATVQQELLELKGLVIPQVYEVVEARAESDPELPGIMLRAVYLHLASKSRENFYHDKA